jgi:hypothetical protein
MVIPSSYIDDVRCNRLKEAGVAEAPATPALVRYTGRVAASASGPWSVSSVLASLQQPEELGPQQPPPVAASLMALP